MSDLVSLRDPEYSPQTSSEAATQKQPGAAVVTEADGSLRASASQAPGTDLGTKGYRLLRSSSSDPSALGQTYSPRSQPSNEPDASSSIHPLRAGEINVG